MTPLGVVFLFMLVNWWVEKHQCFLFNVYKRFFFIFITFLTFLFFLERFFYIYVYVCMFVCMYVCNAYAMLGEFSERNLKPPNVAELK